MEQNNLQPYVDKEAQAAYTKKKEARFEIRQLAGSENKASKQE